MASELAPSVNDAKQVVRAALETPLLFVLRNELKLAGPRLGCGMAQCGACWLRQGGTERLLDRLVHNAHHIEMRRESTRKSDKQRQNRENSICCRSAELAIDRPAKKAVEKTLQSDVAMSRSVLACNPFLGFVGHAHLTAPVILFHLRGTCFDWSGHAHRKPVGRKIDSQY
jgi:hypothetical protein